VNNIVHHQVYSPTAPLWRSKASFEFSERFAQKRETGELFRRFLRPFYPTSLCTDLIRIEIQLSDLTPELSNGLKNAI